MVSVVAADATPAATCAWSCVAANVVAAALDVVAVVSEANEVVASTGPWVAAWVVVDTRELDAAVDVAMSAARSEVVAVVP